MPLLSAYGRQRRTHYWLCWLVIVILNIATSFLLHDNPEQSVPISFMFSGFILIQGIKRMHDTGRSGWYILIPIYNLVLLLTPGEEGANQYGPDPKGQDGERFAGNDVLDSMSVEPANVVDDHKHGLQVFIAMLGFSYFISFCYLLLPREGLESMDYKLINMVSEVLRYSFMLIMMAIAKSSIARIGIGIFLLLSLLMDIIHVVL